MSHADELRQIVGTLMRVMLISERTPAAHQHMERYNPHDFHTLGVLRDTPGLRATELTEYLGVAPTTTSSVIARLVKRGLVSRARHPGDGRAIVLTLTDKGQALAGTVYQQDLSNMRLFLSAMPEDEQAELLRLLGKVVAKVAMLEGR